MVFRGEGDTLTLSFELKDANGLTLLSEHEVSLGPPPTTSAKTLSSSRMLWPAALGAVEAATAAAEATATWSDAAVARLETSATPATLALSPTSRRLLKGGGGGGIRAGGLAGSRAHSYGGRTYSTVASPRVSHTSVSYAPAAGMRTSYGYHHSAAVRAGTFVVLMHHPAGYGRYYDTPGCDDPERGCELRVEEELARDAFATNFTMSDEIAFPLSLRVTKLDVLRSGDGLPSIFLTLYSPTGGVATNTLADQILGLIWVPLLLMIFCFCKFLAACTSDEVRRMH